MQEKVISEERAYGGYFGVQRLERFVVCSELGTFGEKGEIESSDLAWTEAAEALRTRQQIEFPIIMSIEQS